MKDAEQKKLSTILLIIGGATFFLVALSGFFSFKLLNLKHVANELYAGNATFLEEESNVQELKNFVEGTAREQEALNSYFIENKSEVTALLKELESLATSQNISLETTITTEKRKISRESSGDRTMLVLKLEVWGTFKNVYAFMTLLEHLNLKLSFDEVYLRRISDGPIKKGEVPEWSGSFSILVLSYEE